MQFRSNWLVNPATGNYTAYVRTPTGIAADPALTSHGVDQARELAAHLGGLCRSASDGGRGGVHSGSSGSSGSGSWKSSSGGSAAALPAIERIYCSPYFRCLQTVQPFVELVMEDEVKASQETEEAKKGSSLQDTAEKSKLPTPWWAVRCDTGLVDWFGPAPFEHPQPADVGLLQAKFFPWIDGDYRGPAATSGAEPPLHGESMAQLHARMAAAMAHIIRRSDAEGVRAVLVCSHAASIIALGRVLTGRLPADVATEDFGAFTCGLSVFRRRAAGAAASTNSQQQQQKQPLVTWDDPNHTLASQTWSGGRGVEGGWDCEVNCDCSFLSGGEERGWRFSGDDESFAGAGDLLTKTNGPVADAGQELGVVLQGRSEASAQQVQRQETGKVIREPAADDKVKKTSRL